MPQKELQQLTQETFSKFEKYKRTAFINSLSGFKSANLVGTQNKAGETNLAIISSVIHIGANPALMGFIMRPVSVPRDTYQNIIETGYYTFNHISEDFFKQAHQTAARYPENVSEFDAVGLEIAYSNFPAPYLAESSIRIGLQFKEQIEIPLNGTILMIGEVKEVHFPENCLLEDGYLDIEKAGSITCSALDSYHRTQRLARLSFPKPNQPLEEINMPQ